MKAEISRPSVEGIADLLEESSALYDDADPGSAGRREAADRLCWQARQDIPALIAYIGRLEAEKWDVQHTDAMNDMVALGIDRDSWKARVEVLEARQVKLEVMVGAARAVDRMEDLSASRLRKALADLELGDG